MGGAILGAPGAVYHAFADAPTEEEKQKYAKIEKKTGEAPGSETSGAKRVGLGIQRLAIDPVVEAAKDYAAGKVTPKKAASVLPEALGVGAGGYATGEVLHEIPVRAKSARVAALEKMAPRQIPIGDTKVPVLVGEAEPGTTTGRTQAALKRAGAGEQTFRDFSELQQTKVKQVIRQVAKDTSGLVGPISEEVGPAMNDAVTATFAKASPMYDALDGALETIPDSGEKVSKLTQTAIDRAGKLGADVTKVQEQFLSGKKITPGSETWNSLAARGILPKTGGNSISTYMKVRSELLKMQRATSDAGLRNAIGNEISTMNSNMETALKGSPLLDSWKEANRLWSKGYAIRDVADALRESTEGTPAAEQAPGLSKIPTKIKGSQLVQRLNDLQTDGTLARAFNSEEIKNLRQSADILDRASGAPGMGFGFGYGARSTFWRNVIKLPSYPLVKAMTSTKGVAALKSGDFGAFSRLAAASAASSNVVGPKTKQLQELRDQQPDSSQQ
jgi:hypothetical protein